MNPSNRTIDLIAAAAIIAVVLAVFHGLAGGNILVSSDVGTNDLLYFNYPVGKIYGEALRRGEFLQWTPYLYGGFPVFAEGQGSFLYPLNALLWWALNPVAAMNGYILLHAVIMGFGTYLFAGRITGSRIAALGAGVAGALCGSVVVGHVRHLNPLAVIAMTPWLFWIGELFVQRASLKLAPVFGAIIALMIFAGHPNFTFIAAALACLYVLLRRYLASPPDSPPPPSHRSMLAFYGVALSVAVVIALPQLLATIELMGFSRRMTDPGTGFEPTIGSMGWDGILTFIRPYYNGNPADGSLNLELTKPLFYTEGFAYCGVVIFALALWGAIWGWKRWGAVRALSIIAVLSYLLALGNNFVLHRLLLLVPVAKSFRFPVRWLFGTELSVLALSAFGVMALISAVSRIGPKNGQGGRMIPGIVVAMVVAAVAFGDMMLVLGRHVITDRPEKYLSPSLFASRLQTREGVGRVFSLGKFQTHTLAYYTHRGWENDRALYELHTKLLPPNLSAAHHIPVMNGYAILAPNYLYKIWGDANGSGFCGEAFQYNDTGDRIIGVSPGFLTLARMSGLRYVTTPWTLPPPFQQVWDTVEAGTRTRFYAYELPGRFPRAWVVPRVISLGEDDPDAAVRQITAPGFDPALMAVVSGQAGELPPGSTGAAADILAIDNTSVRIRAGSAGLVVLADTWYPRWKATVDGVETPVLRVNSTMRGVVSPRAGAIIQMWYSSGGLPVMVPLSAVVLILSITTPFWKRRQNRG